MEKKKLIIDLFRHSWGLMMSTADTWAKIRSKVTSKNQSFKNFVLPWVLILTSIVFLFKCLYAESNKIETGFIHALVNAISYISAFFISKYFTNNFLKNKHNTFSKLETEIIIAYSSTVVFITCVITTIIPSLYFIQILNIYTIYIVWEGCRVFFKINEDEHGKLILLISGTILLGPSLISRLLFLMLPSI